MATKLRDVFIEEGTLCPLGKNREALIRLVKEDGGEGGEPLSADELAAIDAAVAEVTGSAPAGGTDVTLEEMKKALEEEKAKREAQEKAVEEMKKALDEVKKSVITPPGTTPPPKADPAKADPPAPLSKEVVDLQKELAEQKAAREELAKALAAESGARRDAAALEKARTLCPRVPVEAAELAKAIRQIEDKCDAATLATVEKALRAADGIAASGAELVKSHGKAGSAPAGSSIGTLDGKARELMKADAKLTYDQAFVRAVQANPELYKSYEVEKSQGQAPNVARP